MEKSVLKHTGWLMFIVVAVLLLMGLLPGTTIGTHVLRRVDILGDVAATPESEARLCGHLPQRNDLH